jgi:signal peptidase I
MEPTLSDGSVAVTHPTSPRALEAGDVIAYRSSSENGPVLHRIVSITMGATGELLFTTQGDSNVAADPRPVGLTGQGDKVVYSVPYAGHIIDFASSPPGRAALIGVPLAWLALASVRDAFRKRMEQQAGSRAVVWVEPAAPIEAAPRQRPQAELQPIAPFQSPARPPPAAPIEAAPHQRPQAELQPIAPFQRPARPPPAAATPSAGAAAELPAFLASQLRVFAADPVARPAPFSPRAARPHEREHQDHRAA